MDSRSSFRPLDNTLRSTGIDHQMLDLLPSLDKTTTLVSQRSLARSRRSSYQKISGQSEKQSEEWEDFPFGQPDYNPFVEWGEHYYSIFSRDLWASESTFVLQDLNGDQVSEYQQRLATVSSADQLEPNVAFPAVTLWNRYSR